MKKLELKHLAPYLPHKLRCQAMGEFVEGTEFDDEPSPKILTVTGFFTDSNEETFIEALDKDKDKHEIFFRTDFFPILRPLSDLDEEVKINGEKFIPINSIENYYGRDYLWSIRNNWGEFHYPSLKYASLSKLFEWHFDVFGLIEKGLAIDINSIQ